MTIRKIQKKTAASTDTLLAITGDIDALLSIYGKIDWAQCDLKQTVLLTRCDRLRDELWSMRNELDAQDTDGLSTERQSSIAITRRLIDQNLAVIAQRISLLSDLAATTRDARMKQKTGQDLAALTKMADFKRRLEQT